jgi:hypothetical protein
MRNGTKTCPEQLETVREEIDHTHAATNSSLKYVNNVRLPQLHSGHRVSFRVDLVSHSGKADSEDRSELLLTW